jgi:2-hydroxychromene-2-carboxylate isomerase
VGEIEDVIEDADPSAVGLVLRAAWARLMIAEGGPVSSAQVAALAGLNPRAVRQLVEAGEISAKKRDGDLMVKADEARRWLGARGVAGFDAPNTTQNA